MNINTNVEKLAFEESESFDQLLDFFVRLLKKKSLGIRSD